ncbi:hypothetical protein ACRQ1B_27110 [Rhizobium panacihumi]|uniref:hypothetical protein n=1 Tax=Rhizobium panacihumi TaxID=2008450 RepID=UPI003D7BA91C
MFSKITDVIRDKGNAVDAYMAAAAAAEEAAFSDFERAAEYFLLSAAARECADAHHGLAVHGAVFEHELSKVSSIRRGPRLGI